MWDIGEGMMEPFDQRKRDVLSKEDKSNIGRLDEKIIGLCEKINKSEDYYTTSSCAGRIVVVRDEDRKGPGVFEFVSHDLISFSDLDGVQGENLKLKQEPFILHVACRDVGSADRLLEISKKVGFRRAGIISLGKNVVVEICGSEKLEFPFFFEGKCLVGEEFLKLIAEKSNFNLEKGWERIERLKSLF